MRIMKKQIFSFLLALALVLGMIPLYPITAKAAQYYYSTLMVGESYWLGSRIKIGNYSFRGTEGPGSFVRTGDYYIKSVEWDSTTSSYKLELVTEGENPQTGYIFVGGTEGTIPHGFKIESGDGFTTSPYVISCTYATPLSTLKEYTVLPVGTNIYNDSGKDLKIKYDNENGGTEDPTEAGAVCAGACDVPRLLAKISDTEVWLPYTAMIWSSRSSSPVEVEEGEKDFSYVGYNIMGSEAKPSLYKFESADESIATVEVSDERLIIKGIKPGQTTITATFKADTSFTFTGRVIVKESSKEAAKVTASPTAKADLTETGSAQELVTAGTAEGGTIQYTLGTDAKTAPTDGYSTSIPTGTKAGTYYVWYKVVGDDSHKDSDPACIEVQIKEKKEETNNDSTIETKVEKKDDTPEAKVEGLDSELAESVMTDEEKAKVNAGDDVSLTLEMTNIDSSVAQEEKNLTDNALKNENKNSKVGMFFDISLWLKVGQGEARQVTETGKKVIKVTIQVPDKFKAPAGVKRNFYVIHIHNKVAKVLAKTTSMSIPLSLDGFSTFALAYADEAETEAVNDIFFSGVKITQKDGKIKVAWDKTSGVAKYEVYATYCGNSYPKKATATTKKNTVTLKKINNKKINFKKNFKLYVVAYDGDGNQVGKTVSAHFAGKDNKKFKNIKTLKLSTKSITVAVGKTSKIKASTTLEKGKKKELSDNHAAKFRYKSTNKSIAKVDKNGKVTGVSAGKCAVYVYSRNGLAKKVSVTVK